jgi:EcsC protein family
MTKAPTEWPAEDNVALRRAKSLLEHPGLAVRIANAVGQPIEKLFTMLPESAAETIRTATTKSLNAAVRLATSRMDEEPRTASATLHTLAVAATGALGGAFGLAALAAELPASTTIMMRSIADIARSEGHSIKSPRIQLACVEVFALGGSTSGDDASEAGYFAVRAALAKAVTEAVEHLAARGLSTEAAPAIVGLVTKVAARFGIPVTEKVMAQSVPILGAAGGAMINVLFINHFQDVARGHFTVLRLEEKYDADTVKQAYAALS